MPAPSATQKSDERSSFPSNLVVQEITPLLFKTSLYFCRGFWSLPLLEFSAGS